MRTQIKYSKIGETGAELETKQNNVTFKIIKHSDTTNKQTKTNLSIIEGRKTRHSQSNKKEKKKQ